MEIIFLGTASMVPTKERNPQAILISYGSEGVLVDCGEGTQKQMKINGIKLTKITKILISHWHGDHVLGLPGLIMSLGASSYKKTLEVYGPKGFKKRFQALKKLFLPDLRINLRVVEVDRGVFFENGGFILEALPLDHGIPSLGFNFIEKSKRKINLKKTKKFGLPAGPLLGKLQGGSAVVFKGKKIKPGDVTILRKGKKVTILTDTKLCGNCYVLAKGADLLISEATFVSELEKKSKEYYHMTAKQAAQVAKKAGVSKLVLTHFSARYKDTKEIEKDAKVVFKDVVCAKDFTTIKL